MQTQAEADITNGASVLVIDAARLRAAAPPSRRTPPPRASRSSTTTAWLKGGAAGRTYVSFDNVKVGQLIGQG